MKKLSLIPWLACAALGTTFIPGLHAQVAYSGGFPWSQRVDSGPDAEVPGWYYNLGITGIRAELTEENPKALLVRHVFSGTAARDLVQVGDWIVGVHGRNFIHPHRNGYGMEIFGADGPVSELAVALEKCQGKSGNGKLPLLVQRGTETLGVELDIGKKYGSYTASYPASCPKTAKILKELLPYIASQQQDDGSFGDPVHNTFSALALLGTGDKQYLPAVERNLQFLSRSIRKATAFERKYGLINWTYTGAAIVMSEYYLITRKPWVLKELENIRKLLEDGQYLDMSQIDPKVRETHPDSYPTRPRQAHGGWGHNPGFEGYGPIAMITAQGALSFSLMHRCGIQIDRKRLESAFQFLKRGTGQNGYLWYGDSPGGGPDDWADMGRTGAAAIANFLSPYRDYTYRVQSTKYSNIIGRHPQSFPDTHGSPPMGMAYEALGANIDSGNFRKLMAANRWWFTMAQCADGTFYYQPNRDNAGYDSQARLTASSVVAFIFTIPKRNLVITGRTAP